MLEIVVHAKHLEERASAAEREFQTVDILADYLRADVERMIAGRTYRACRFVGAAVVIRDLDCDRSSLPDNRIKLELS